jgi:starch synthase
MEPKRILYVAQSMHPYLSETILAEHALAFPKRMNELGNEVRVFMPRYGNINERRHQLHEVIRLSGMNVVINDMDQPLIIKVASIPQARLQVYFIDNDEYFKRKGDIVDAAGTLYEDSDERALFFSKSVIETIKKLGWKPDVVHVMGWMCSPMPLYIRQFNATDAHFADVKVVVSLYDTDAFSGQLGPKLPSGMHYDGAQAMEAFEQPTYENLQSGAVRFADAILTMTDSPSEHAVKTAQEFGIPVSDGRPFAADPSGLKAFYESLFA